MENEPVERSSLHFIHFKVRLKWLRENDLHVHEIMERQEEMPRFVDLHKALSDTAKKGSKKFPLNML